MDQHLNLCPKKSVKEVPLVLPTTKLLNYGKVWSMML